MMRYSSKYFKQILKEKEVTQFELANMLHINPKTFSFKVNGRYQWLLKEMIEICDYLGIGSIDSLFIEK